MRRNALEPLKPFLIPPTETAFGVTATPGHLAVAVRGDCPKTDFAALGVMHGAFLRLGPIFPQLSYRQAFLQLLLSLLTDAVAAESHMPPRGVAASQMDSVVQLSATVEERMIATTNMPSN